MVLPITTIYWIALVASAEASSEPMAALHGVNGIQSEKCQTLAYYPVPPFLHDQTSSAANPTRNRSAGDGNFCFSSYRKNSLERPRLLAYYA